MAALFLAGGVFLYRADQNLKRGDSFPGMLPEDADWAVFVPDFTATWRRFEAHPVGGLLREYYPRAQSEAVLAARLATGVRPTPGRWSAWLGRPVMLGWRGGEWGACLRPGLLLRAALRGAEVLDDAYSVFGLHHAWRNGILLVSPSLDYVQDAFNAPAFHLGGVKDTDICWSDPKRDRYFRINMDNSGRVQCVGHYRLNNHTFPDETSLIMPDWPGTPAVQLTISDNALLHLLSSACVGIARNAFSGLTVADPISPMIKSWETIFSIPDNPPALAWYGLSWNGAVPFPQIAAVWDTKDYPDISPLFLAARQDPVARPFIWDGKEGLLLPMFGPELTLCLLPMEQNRLLMTTRESVMEQVSKVTVRDSSDTEDCIFLCVNSASLANELAAGFRRAASLGWIPNMDERDLERDILPMLRVLGGLGTLRVHGTFQHGKIVQTGAILIEGTLELEDSLGQGKL